MKTMKHLFYLAVSLILLVSTSSDVYAYGNDWFEDENNFIAYYDGMGNIQFDLLVWSEGGNNHWAWDGYGGTYIEYTTNPDAPNPTYTKLFYYKGDNVKNKEKGNGYVWIKPEVEKGSLTVLNSTTGLDQQVDMKNKETYQEFKLPHNGDERRSVSVSLKWSIPQELEDSTITVHVHVCDTRETDFWFWDYKPIKNQKLEKGDVPELQKPLLYQGGRDKDAAGQIMVPYVFVDQPESYTTSFNPKKIVKIEDLFGYITLPATDSLRKNFYITAEVKRMNGQPATVRSNSVDIPPYHKITDFSVDAYCNYARGGNTGSKVLKWKIKNPSAQDIVPVDFFEIQRAYKADFSDAQTIANSPYVKNTMYYQYIDSSAGSINPKSDTVHYRIRRMSSSAWGWNHDYAQSASYIESIRQMGLDLYKNEYTPYVAFQDCSDDSIDIVGLIIWPDSTMMRTVAWDQDVTMDICLKDEQGIIPRKTLNLDSLTRWTDGSKVIWGFSFKQPLPTACQRYNLFVRLNAENTRFVKPQNTEVWFYPKRRTSAINVLSVTATDSVEIHPAYTAIHWVADGRPDQFTIWRSNEQNSFDSIAVVDSKQDTYLDTQAKPGVEYTYKVEAVTLCTGIRLSSSKEDKGSRSRYGYIEGYVSYTNGDKVAKINVTLKDTATKETLQVKTSADGYYKFSHIRYDLDKGSTYSIIATGDNQTFHPTAGSAVAYVKLTESVPEIKNINFESSDYKRYSGRVLYTGTTIPVRDAFFLISDSVAMSGGDTVRSDASGNFVLSVPSGPNFRLTVVKNKHTFVNDGRLFNGNSDTLNAQSGSLDGLRFWDNTRARLVGRLAGGDIQGLKPLGFGLSTNNLGDTLKLVFELEGDNIAHFVFDEKDLTKNTRDTTFVCVVGKDTTLRTPVRFEQKRVIVSPDRKTGEYVIDLPPVKYRIVEASANGYATLFSAGRTSETKDLTYSLDTVRVSYDDKQTWYHDTYSVIYHAPASVAVTQLRFGVPMSHYGEEVVEGYTLSNHRMDTVCYQKDGKWIQKFGYPVYISGLQYAFRINAREEYRYNNDRNNAPDLVPLGNHTYAIYNGLKSGTSIIRGGLDNLGNADVVLDVENMSFDGAEEQVLKHFDVSVEINGQDVHAEPMRAFVTGSRITGADAMQDIGAKITVEDVLRDPPGTSSYAWLEKGVTYTTSYNVANAFNIGTDVSITAGKSLNQSVGAVVAPQGQGTYNGVITGNSSGTSHPIAAFTQGFSWNQNYTYSYTTSERIQTSSEANIMGADATLFIGHTINAYAMNAETFNVVDSATLKMMQPAIDEGVAHVVKKDSITGSALVVTQDLAFTLDKEPVRFVYTQAHIVKQIIPQLMAQMASLLRTGTQQEMQALANATQDYVYWYKQDYNPQVDTVPYTLVKPNPMPKNKPLVNKMMGYNSLIRQWLNALITNEYCELYGTMPQNRVVSYSVSDNSSVTHTETGSVGYNYSEAITEKPSSGILNNLTGLIPAGGSGELQALATIFMTFLVDNEEYEIQQRQGTIVLNNPIKTFQFNWTIDMDYNRGDTKGRDCSKNRTIGFTLAQAEYGYIDVDVYRLTGTVDFNNDSTVISWRNQAINTITRKDMDTSGYECSDFIYLLRGGATRCMWIPERKTEFYRPGTLLDPPTIKLDEAHLEVDQHEVSGVAADGVAVFDLQIWNESEAAAGVANGPHNFVLKLLESSNPNGAKATIDGLPLTQTGRNFYLEPGQIIRKKMEIRQGAVALNYDSLKLCLISDCDTSNYAMQSISVHFLPASSPVRIATPDDKWVMNTNSPYDKEGYYLPVVIDGFDPDYANFDHIELQYKLSTQSENNWVTLCSYYKKEDSVYYNKASGNKQYFNKEAGRIDNIHFYGERDPMEQRYDLRAVSYCRYGTGYVTKASAPISGIKDTRRPELFGNVAPANGILTQQDYISVPFSEPIAYNYLDEDNNFQVVGFKNKADYYDMPTLLFGGNGYATTKTSHNLTQSDFTIDITVLQDAGTEPMTYFSTGENVSGNEKGVEFGWTGSSLYAKIGNQIILSEQKEMPKAFTRMILTYDKAKKEVGFYLGGQPLQAQVGEAYSDNCTAPFIFGVDKNLKNPFRGRMIETRIWTKALTMEEVQSSSGTGLTGYEKGLLAYYPMNEGYGTTAYDKAHGANATLHNLTWNMPQGLAIRTSGEGVQLDPKWFNNSADADYTLILNFKSNPSSSFNGDALLFGDKEAKRDTANRQVGIFITQTGQIEIAFGSTKRLTADGNYNDGAWHSLGLVVSRGFNYTHLYIDDKLKAQADGQFFGVWAMSETYLGKNFDGYFDELSIWELAMPQSYLSKFNVWAPNGQELGLRCYLPFDQRVKNAASIYETHYSPYNARLYYNSDKQEWYAKQDTVVISELDDQSTTKDVCPLIRNSEYEKMRFSWTSRDNDLVINLKMPDAEINHKSIFFSLRDVEDLQGNRLLSPIAWSVYLDRNIIRWAEQNLWVEKSAGTIDTVVYTTITNYSGETKPFVISGLPEWLTVDEPIGMLQPQEERVLAFTISGDLNAGDYVVPIALTDEADLSDQMLINVRVNAVFPNWSIPNSFNLNMNLIGTVHLRDGARGTYVDTDTRDIVGAFYGNTCVGMQTITSKVGSTANLYLKVYGKADMNKKDISLRLWQASTGKTFELAFVPDSAIQSTQQNIRFVPDTIYGSVQKPIDFYVADSRVQNIPIYTGWNWISFNVQPTDINSSFVNVGGFETNDEIKAYSAQDNVSNYMESGWSKNIKLNYRNIYMLKVKNNMVLEVRGTAAGQAPELTFRHGWNNLPCLFESNTPVDAAMADYFNAAKDGDIITGYYQFAVFNNKQWVGSLETLIPGEGYMLYRQDTKDVTVHFYPSAPASAPRKKVESERGSESRTYSTAMPIVATLENNEVAINLDNAVLRAYAHDELVGEAKAVDGMWFLLVHAKDNAELTFTVTDDKGEEHSASNVLNYGAFAPTGTVHNPYLIRFGESDLRKVMENGILYIHRNGNTYNAQGGKL